MPRGRARDHALDRRDLRVPRRHDRRDDLTEQHARFVGRARRQRNVDVQAARAGRLREAGTPSDVQLVADPARDVEHAGERRAVGRIEIDRDVVGVERRLHAREPRVLRDRRKLRHVEQRRQRSADEALRVRLADRVELVGQRLDPHARGRPLFARALLIERLARDAVGKPLHHQRPIVDDRQE